MSKQKQLPTKPHLQALKKQARQLLNAHQAGQPQAANRIRSYLPRLRPATNAAILQNSFTLQDAQCVIAREYGQPNWAMLAKAVGILRHAAANAFPLVEAALQRGQPIHLLPPNERAAADMARKLGERFGQDTILWLAREDTRTFNGALLSWLRRLGSAKIVVSIPQVIGFLPLYDRLAKREAPLASDVIFSKAHALVNVPFAEEQNPLIISAYDQERDGPRDLIAMHLPEFYNLYGTITDQRF